MLANQFYEENKRLSIRKGILSSALSIFGTLGYYAAYVVILARTISGSITIGSLTFLAASFGRSRDIVQRVLSNASDISEQSLYLKDLFDFFEMKPTITTASGEPPGAGRDQGGLRVRGCRLSVSGKRAMGRSARQLRAAPGERIALVGENGAGKTTLTKLLPRLYDPTEGRILLDGVDIREYDLAQLRRTVGVIFQDFVRFDMRFDENIGVGEIERVRGYLDHANGDGAEPPVPAELVNAAEQSLAASLLPRFAGGYQQMLGRRFEGGVASVRRRVAEDRARARVSARGAAPDPRRADGGARCARGVRGVHALLGARRRTHGGAHLAPVLDGAHGGPHHRAPERRDRRGGHARRAGRERRALLRAVHAAGGGVPVALRSIERGNGSISWYARLRWSAVRASVQIVPLVWCVIGLSP